MEKTRIKKIMDTAKERYPGIRNSSAQWAFIDGVCWADRNPQKRLPWHSVEEEPKKNIIFIAVVDGGHGNVLKWVNQEETWEFFACAYGILRWIYLSDIIGLE